MIVRSYNTIFRYMYKVYIYCTMIMCRITSNNSHSGSHGSELQNARFSGMQWVRNLGIQTGMRGNAGWVGRSWRLRAVCTISCVVVCIIPGHEVSSLLPYTQHVFRRCAPTRAPVPDVLPLIYSPSCMQAEEAILPHKPFEHREKHLGDCDEHYRYVAMYNRIINVQLYIYSI